MIDPLTALAGIQSAISMVKKASKVANDLGSLAPMIGKMFDAKSTATKALIKARQDQMDIDDARELRALERAEKKAKEKEEELNELAMIIGGCAFVVFLVAIGIYELMEFCATGRRCGR